MSKQAASSALDDNASKDVSAHSVINVNVGIMGHVDSGKTSLVKALSTSLSTAALDKSPQSQQRGITLDLGFSSFSLPMPEHLKQESGPNSTLQFTLVDCPGHASLIRTIIGGAQIIDMVILVIDANKGIQTQTAECIVIAEITTRNLIIVLNKIDVIPIEEREAKLEKVKMRIMNTFKSTKFRNAPIICTAAFPGGEKVASIGGQDTNSHVFDALASARKSDEKSIGMDELVAAMRSVTTLPSRDYNAPFYFAIDHCFQIKGHGTILTGTVLSGSVAVNQVIEMPTIQQQRKVKSMQMFHKNVKQAKQGDRVGMCVTNLDAETIERGIAVAPGSVPLLHSVICLVKKVRFFRGACKSNMKYHVSIGHTTIIATVTFFGAKELDMSASHEATSSSARCIAQCEGFPALKFDWDQLFETQDGLVGANNASDDDQTSTMKYGEEQLQWACVRFQQPIYCPMGSLVIGSRLDTDTREDGNGSKLCRIAFFGPIIEAVETDESSKRNFESIRIYAQKQKQAQVLKLTDVRSGGLCHELLACKLFREGGTLTPFIGMKLKTARGYIGTITAPYGSGDQFKVKFPRGVPRSSVLVGAALYLPFKRFVNGKDKTMVQMGADLDETVRPTTEAASDDVAIPANTTPAPVPAESSAREPSKNIEADALGGTTALAEKKSLLAADAAPSSSDKPKLELRFGVVESLKEPASVDGKVVHHLVIVSGAFKMEENIREHVGALVEGPGGQAGEVIGPFAKLGKCKIKFECGFSGLEGTQVKISLRR